MDTAVDAKMVGVFISMPLERLPSNPFPAKKPCGKRSIQLFWCCDHLCGERTSTLEHTYHIFGFWWKLFYFPLKGILLPIPIDSVLFPLPVVGNLAAKSQDI